MIRLYLRCCLLTLILSIGCAGISLFYNTIFSGVSFGFLCVGINIILLVRGLKADPLLQHPYSIYYLFFERFMLVLLALLLSMMLFPPLQVIIGFVFGQLLFVVLLGTALRKKRP